MLFPELFRKWADLIEAEGSPEIEVEMDTYSVGKKGNGKFYETFTINVYVDVPEGVIKPSS